MLIYISTYTGLWGSQIVSINAMYNVLHLIEDGVVQNNLLNAKVDGRRYFELRTFAIYAHSLLLAGV